MSGKGVVYRGADRHVVRGREVVRGFCSWGVGLPGHRGFDMTGVLSGARAVGVSLRLAALVASFLPSVSGAADPDAGRILARGFTTYGIWQFDAFNPGTRTLFEGGQYIFCPAWSPAGDRVALIRRKEPPQTIFWTYSIVIFSREGVEVETVLDDKRIGQTALAWSPDGTEIAYNCWVGPLGDETDFEMCAVNVETGAVRMITPTGDGIAADGQYSWSRDGREIAFTAGRTKACGTNGTSTCYLYDIGVVDARGGTPQLLTSDNWSRYPDFSPDGGEIVFATYSSLGGGTPGINILSRTGGIRHVSPTGDLGSPSRIWPRFSPDGEQIMFTSNGFDTVNASVDVFIVDKEGGVPFNTTRTSWDDQIPAWTSPLSSCTILGTPEDDEIKGTPRGDVICAGDGDDTIRGRGGDDRILGGAGNDTIYGGSGDDTILGEDGDDKLKGRGGDDTIEGGAGIDRFKGGAGDDTLRAEDGESPEPVNGGPGLGDTCESDLDDKPKNCE